MFKRFAAPALLAVGVALPDIAICAESVLDDFSSGAYQKTTTCAETPTGIRAFKTGSMVGGVRGTVFIVHCNNPFDQPATLDIAKGGPALVLDSGVRVGGAVDVQYGYNTNGGLHPLNLDLSQYNLLRFRFDSSDHVVNFNVIVFMHTDDAARQARVHGACNLQPGPANGAPFNVDMPFNLFRTELGTADWSDVDEIVLEFVSASNIGGNDYAVTSFSASDTPDPTAVVCAITQ
jgi:hypothetical protein